MNIRKLVAVDIAFLGSRLILTEFSVGVFGSFGLGILTLARTDSLGWILFGPYLVCIGITYVPLRHPTRTAMTVDIRLPT